MVNCGKRKWVGLSCVVGGDMVNEEMKGVRNERRKNVLMIDESVFKGRRWKKREVG